MASQATLDALTATWEPETRRAFLDAIDGITSRQKVNAIAELIDAGKIDDAIEAIGLDPTDFRGLDQSIRGAFEAAGIEFEKVVPDKIMPNGAVLNFVFDIRSPAAEQWAREKSSNLVTEIIDDQKTAIRNTITAGIESGTNPRTTALDIVGRVDRKSGKREGGTIGLTSKQEQWQRNYAAELASTDPKDLRNALTRGLRDKRFDGAIKKAISTGEPIPNKTQAKMVRQYRNRSLKYRADVIARTESIQAFGQAQVENFDQAIDRGHVISSNVIKRPISAKDERVRHNHRTVEEMNKKGVAWDKPYKVPKGMAPQKHAPYNEPMCRCREIVKIKYRAD